MKRLALALALAALAAPALAAQPKTYQVTGPVLELTADTKVTGDLKKGEKVTIEYRMTAATVEVKAAKPAKK